jgi:hypothetical protein
MTGRAHDSPPWWSLVTAFATAPAVAALAFSSLSPMYEGLPDLSERIWKTFLLVAVVGGYLPTLVVGLPAYFILRRRFRPTFLNCALAGSAVADLPWLPLVLFPFADEASIGSRATVVHHHLTWFGLYEGMTLVGQIAAFGLLGGVVFWLLVSLSALRTPRMSS